MTLKCPGEKCWSSRQVPGEHRKLLSGPSRSQSQPQPLCLLPSAQLARPMTTLPPSADEATFGMKGHFNQEISKVNGVEQQHTARNCLPGIRKMIRFSTTACQVCGSGEGSVVCPDQLTSLSVFTLHAQPNSSGLVLSHGPPAGQMPVPGHEEEWEEIASLLNDTFFTQVRRTGDNEIATGR